MNPIEAAEKALRASLVHCVKCGLEHPKDGRCIVPAAQLYPRGIVAWDAKPDPESAVAELERIRQRREAKKPVTLTDVLVYEAEQDDLKPKRKRAKKGEPFALKPPSTPTPDSADLRNAIAKGYGSRTNPRSGRGLRLKTGEMNKTEARYAKQLEHKRRRGEILNWWFEGITFRLADDNSRYTPDFLVLMPDGALECHEIKGHWEIAALVRIKVAADRYPFKFIALSKPKGSDWQRRELKGWSDGEPEAKAEPATEDDGGMF